MAGEWPSLVNAFSEFIEHVRPRPRPSIHPSIHPPPPPRTALVASGRAAVQAEVGLAHVRARLDIAQARYSDVLEYLGENPKTENCDALGQVRGLLSGRRAAQRSRSPAGHSAAARSACACGSAAPAPEEGLAAQRAGPPWVAGARAVAPCR
jgi:hypothetical protein